MLTNSRPPIQSGAPVDAPELPDFFSAKWAEVRVGDETEARGLRGVAESGELVEAGAVRAGNALIELQERIEPGLWLAALRERGIKQPWAWYRMEFAKIPEDDRPIYLRRNRFSVKRAVVEYRKKSGLTRRKGAPAEGALFPGNSPAGAEEVPAGERDEMLAEVARRVEFALQMVDDREADLAAGPDPDWALGEIADDLRAAAREVMAAIVKKRLLGEARG